MANQRQSQSDHNSAVEQEVDRHLNNIPAFRGLDSGTQSDLKSSMTKIANYLSGAATGLPYEPLVGQLAPPNLQERLSPQNNPRSPNAQDPSQPSSGRESPVSGGGQGVTGRVGEVARATLNAIDFPTFISSLIQGTFQAIVDSSIQQMEAYADLLRNVASTVDQFMSDNISDGTARDYLADKYSDILTRDTSAGQPRLRVRDDARDDAMPSFLQELGFDSPYDIDENSVEEVIVPAARRNLAETRQQTLSTLVLMGINRIKVDDGEISAKLQFHIDASETTELRFDQTKTTVGNISGRAGRSPFSANAVMVNTTSLNAQSDINVRTDLVGEVKVRFSSETFPLERFADSAAIQLINQNATVPQNQPASENAPPEQESPTVSQSDSSLSETVKRAGFDDPWVPRKTQ